MTESASVEVLSAKIRVLQVGSGQMTRSMYRQLDKASLQRFEPFGRVKDNKLISGEGALQLLGRDTRTGALVRHDAQPPDWPPTLEEPSGVKVVRYDELRPDWPGWEGPSEFAHWLLHTEEDPRPFYLVADGPDGRRVVWTRRAKTHCPSRKGWHVSQDKPQPWFWQESSGPKQLSKERGTINLDELEQTWRAEAQAQLARLLEAQARYEKFAALPLIVFPD
jgi:hypothetical protein